MRFYRIAAKAKSDLRSIWNYTYDNWSEEQADKYLGELMEEFEIIVQYPERGKVFDEVRNGFYGVKKNRHIIFYRLLSTKEIEIIRVLHERMDIASRLS